MPSKRVSRRVICHCTTTKMNTHGRASPMGRGLEPEEMNKKSYTGRGEGK